MQVFLAVHMKKAQGFRDYCLRHLLFYSGARASEIATVNRDSTSMPTTKRSPSWARPSAITKPACGPKPASSITRYIQIYRGTPIPWYHHRLFINERGQTLTRSGIHRLCKNYLHCAAADKVASIHPSGPQLPAFTRREHALSRTRA